MKRTLAITLMLTLALIMQAETTVTFMGVPMEGSQQTFTQQLLKKYYIDARLPK